MVEAAALDRVVQIARAVGGQDDDRRVRGADRAELGDRHRRLAEQLEQERLEVVVGAVDLVDQQHRRARAGVLERAQQRPPDQVVGAEQVLLAELVAGRLGEPDGQQLARVVPLVERLGGVDALVALEADQRRVEHHRQRARRLGLADARLALEQQRLRETQRQEHRRRQPLVDEVVDGGQPLRQRLDVGDELVHADRRVILERVDVERDRARDRHVLGALVDQPPHALVAVQVRERAEPRARERDRMPAPVVIGADRKLRLAAPGEQRPHRLRRHPGWSPSISTSTSQRGSTTPSAAAIEDEQPSP